MNFIHPDRLMPPAARSSRGFSFIIQPDNICCPTSIIYMWTRFGQNRTKLDTKLEQPGQNSDNFGHFRTSFGIDNQPVIYLIYETKQKNI